MSRSIQQWIFFEMIIYECDCLVICADPDSSLGIFKKAIDGGAGALSAENLAAGKENAATLIFNQIKSFGKRAYPDTSVVIRERGEDKAFKGIATSARTRETAWMKHLGDLVSIETYNAVSPGSHYDPTGRIGADGFDYGLGQSLGNAPVHEVT